VYTQKTDIDSFIVGLGVGYKWTMGDSFAIQPFANIARNFSDEVQDRFSAIEFNAGINIGYRF
jgi:outer membrane autotransporter protein